MAVYLDVSAAVHRRAGLGRYASRLASALAARNPERYALFFNRERGVVPLLELAHLPARTVALGYKPWRLLVWLAHLAHAGFDRLVPGADLFHATEHLLLPLHSVPTVLTVHDLVFRHLPEHHKPLNRWYLNLTLPLYCRRATHIIAVSEWTRNDLIAAYGLPPDKVTTIHEAADPRFRPQSAEDVIKVRARYGLPDRYLLFVGTIEPRKNLTRLLSALELVLSEGLTDGLVIVGKRGWLTTDFFTRLGQSSARDSTVLPGYIPDEDLASVYTGSQALVFPSLYEGFGLPVLEAMACGTPVLTSHTSSMPEIAGEAALTFDPHSVEEMIEAIRQVLGQSELRERLRGQGLAQATRFSWERAATETEAVYDLVCRANA